MHNGKSARGFASLRLCFVPRSLALHAPGLYELVWDYEVFTAACSNLIKLLFGADLKILNRSSIVFKKICAASNNVQIMG